MTRRVNRETRTRPWTPRAPGGTGRCGDGVLCRARVPGGRAQLPGPRRRPPPQQLPDLATISGTSMIGRALNLLEARVIDPGLPHQAALDARSPHHPQFEPTRPRLPRPMEGALCSLLRRYAPFLTSPARPRRRRLRKAGRLAPRADRIFARRRAWRSRSRSAKPNTCRRETRRMPAG
jgi:hypothetical protein